ncbi:MAG: peptidylprolyl isomerase [Paracoccaceae bacterium]
MNFLRVLVGVAVMLSAAAPALAQNPYSAAWRVNQSIISHYDIDQRMRLMRALGAPAENLRRTAVSDLIDDRLRVDLGRRMGLEVTDDNIARSIEVYATQRNLTGPRLLGQLRSAGVSQEALEDFLAASLIWRTVLNMRFGDRANPTEDELNAQVSSIGLSSSRSVQLGELVLPYLERGQDETADLARRLQAQLDAGGDWAAAVAEYSRAGTAERGGVIGWVDPNRLPEQIGAAIRGVRVGGVSQPIFVPSGVILIKVMDSRTVTQQIVVPIDVSVSYAEILLPNPGGTLRAQMSEADRFRRTLAGCRQLDERAAAANGSVTVYGLVDLDALPADTGLALSRLDPRESVALPQPNALRILVLCERQSSMDETAREIMRNQLRGRALSAMSDGLLLELRRTALIEEL